MPCTLYVAWDERLAAYDFGPDHPISPVRLDLTIELARTFGLFAEAGVSVERAPPATDVQLELVHIESYIAAVRLAGQTRTRPLRFRVSASVPGMTRCFPVLTTWSGRWWGQARPWQRPARSGPARHSTALASRVACTTRCEPAPGAASAYITTRRSRSPGCRVQVRKTGRLRRHRRAPR